MHELSVCLALMQQVETICDQHHARRVEKIFLQIGPLSGIEQPLLERAFPLAAIGTRAENATLVIAACPVVVQCTSCGGESEVPPNRLLCKHCGDFRTRLVTGEEMMLASLELDLGAADASVPDGDRQPAVSPAELPG